MPSNHWRNEPLIGNNSWRKDNEGNAAGWNDAIDGWTPYGAAGTSRSARFHSSTAPLNSRGNLSLYVDCSTGFSSKELKFYYFPGDSLTVQLSTDGGLNFTTLEALEISSKSWKLHTLGFNSSSANTVIRFTAKKTEGSYPDVQIDEVSVSSVPCFTPLSITVKPLLNTAEFSFKPSATGSPSGYEYAVTTSLTPPASGTFTSNISGTLTGLTASTNYFIHLRSVCTGVGNSPWISQSFKTATANCAPQYNLNCTYTNAFNFIRGFTLKGENGTVIRTTNTPCSPNGYYDLTASSDVTLSKGKSYICIVSTDTISTLDTWIDFNDDGAFTYNEKLVNRFVSEYRRVNNLISLYIPDNVQTGSHRLRIRMNASDPCEAASEGQAHDYTVTIAEASAGAAYAVSSGIGNNCISGGSLTINEASNNNTSWVPLTDTANNVIASINANGNNLNRVDVYEYINNGIVRRTTDGKPYLDRNVQISVETQPATNVGIRVYILQSEFDALKAADPSIQNWGDLWMSRTAQACGNSLGAGLLLQPVNSGAVTNGFFIEYTISGFSSFFFNNGSGALPVTIKYFHAERQGKVNSISWATVTESNNAGFDIEKSADGIAFNKVAFVASKALNGNSASKLDYFFDDTNPDHQDTYYRLKQTDRDGRIDYSIAVLIKGDNFLKLKLKNVFPNPVRHLLNIEVSSAKADKVIINVSGISSKVFISNEQQINTSDNQIEVNVSQLPAGTYLLKIVSKTTGEEVISKFVKL